MTKRAERESRRAARQLELAAEIERARRVMRPPAALGSWGVVKVRCWVYLHDRLRRYLQSTRLRANRLREPNDALTEINRLRELNNALTEIDRWPPDKCHSVVVKKSL